MAKEIKALKMATESPPKPYTVILGGVKCDDSLDIALNLCERSVADTVVFVGAVGNLMLWADGNKIGTGNEAFLRKELGDAFDSTMVMANKLLAEHNQRLLLPLDVAAEIDGERVDLPVEQLPPSGPLFDIGLFTCMKIREHICLLYTSPSPRDATLSRMPSSA